MKTERLPLRSQSQHFSAQMSDSRSEEPKARLEWVGVGSSVSQLRLEIRYRCFDCRSIDDLCPFGVIYPDSVDHVEGGVASSGSRRYDPPICTVRNVVDL
jgi:hypothetical protein